LKQEHCERKKLAFPKKYDLFIYLFIYLSIYVLNDIIIVVKHERPTFCSVDVLSRLSQPTLNEHYFNLPERKKWLKSVG